MKLFGDFEAVKFPEENVILITQRGYLYYYYQPRYEHWERHKNAGNDMITVGNYPDVSKKELSDAMGGKFPEKVTDILRLLYPSQLYIVDMIHLLEEDYASVTVVPKRLSFNQISLLITGHGVVAAFQKTGEGIRFRALSWGIVTENWL